jgi:hypothetical protein
MCTVVGQRTHAAAARGVFHVVIAPISLVNCVWSSVLSVSIVHHGTVIQHFAVVFNDCFVSLENYGIWRRTSRHSKQTFARLWYR